MIQGAIGLRGASILGDLLSVDVQREPKRGS